MLSTATISPHRRPKMISTCCQQFKRSRFIFGPWRRLKQSCFSEKQAGADFCISFIRLIKMSCIFEAGGRHGAIPFSYSVCFDAAADVSEAKRIQHLIFTKISPIFDTGGRHSIVPSLCSFCFNAAAAVSQSKTIQHIVALLALALLGTCCCCE